MWNLQLQVITSKIEVFQIVVLVMTIFGFLPIYWHTGVKVQYTSKKCCNTRALHLPEQLCRAQPVMTFIEEVIIVEISTEGGVGGRRVFFASSIVEGLTFIATA